MIAGACALLGFGGEAAAVLLAMLFLGQAYFARRFALIITNAEHVNLICLAALAAAGWPGASPDLRAGALAFIGFQSLLGYVASGANKLMARNWRSGARLIAVFQDSSYRVPWLGRLLSRRPRLGAVLSWSVILLELLFPLCLWLPPAGFWAFIAAGLAFHASIAVLMALPEFLWAFGATYPALYFLHGLLAKGSDHG